MKQSICLRKQILDRIRKDLRKYGMALLLTGVTLIILQAVFHTVCPMRILFQIPCPGCGLTHAGWYVLTFRWRKAWQWNPTIFLWMFCMGAWFVSRYIKAEKSRFLWIVLVITCCATLVRYDWKYAEEILEAAQHLRYCIREANNLFIS